jgi:hypothetical protein
MADDYNTTVFMEQGGDRQINTNISRTTAASTAVSNYGVTILKGSAAMTCTLNQPDRKGITKQVIVLTTFVTKLKCPPTVNGSTATKVFSIANSTKFDHIGTSITLYSLSTSAWYAMVSRPSTGSGMTGTLTSAT